MASGLNAGRVRCFNQKHLTLYDMAYDAVWQKVVCHDGMSSRLDSGSRQYAWLPAMMCVHCRLSVAKAANNMHEKYVYKSRVKMGQIY